MKSPVMKRNHLRLPFVWACLCNDIIESVVFILVQFSLFIQIQVNLSYPDTGMAELWRSPWTHRVLTAGYLAAIGEVGERGMMSLPGWDWLRRTMKSPRLLEKGYLAEIQRSRSWLVKTRLMSDDNNDWILITQRWMDEANDLEVKRISGS